jgi:hypothetical protein
MRKQPVSAGGLSKARLRHMHDVMAGYVERGNVPGLLTLVSRRGKVHVEAIGSRDPIRRDSPPSCHSPPGKLLRRTPTSPTVILTNRC